MSRIFFFGPLGDLFGREVEFPLPEGGCTIAQLRDLLQDRFAATDNPLETGRILACIDHDLVRDDALVRPGQEVAFLPPLSGG